MDIAKISMALAQTQTLSNVGIAVLDKTMESSEVLGQGIMKMMDAAAMESLIVLSLCSAIVHLSIPPLINCGLTQTGFPDTIDLTTIRMQFAPL